MVGLNKVQLIGRLGRDPESRHIPSGATVCSFSVAVNRMWRGSDGEQKEATDWFNVEAWGKLASTGLSKDEIDKMVNDAKAHESEDKVKYLTKVVISEMQMLDRKPEEPEVETE